MMEIDAQAWATLPLVVQASGPREAALYLAFFDERVANPHTRRAYRRAADDFLDWCHRTNGVEALSDIAPVQVAAWREEQFHTLAPASARLRLAALRALFRWLAAHGVTRNPAATLRPAGSPPPVRPTPQLTEAELNRLLASLDPADPAGARDRALIATMADLRLRVGEVISLCLRGLSETDGTLSLTVPSRNGAGRALLLPPRPATELRRLLAHLGADAHPDGPLFPSMPRGTRRLGSSPMVQTDVFRMVRRRARAAGLDLPLSTRGLVAARAQETAGSAAAGAAAVPNGTPHPCGALRSNQARSPARVRRA
jgi:integrase